MNALPTLSLDRLQAGSRAVIRRFVAGNELISRLAALGLTVGTTLEVMQNTGHGPMLVKVHHTRVALGRGEAVKVEVEMSAP